MVFKGGVVVYKEVWWSFKEVRWSVRGGQWSGVSVPAFRLPVPGSNLSLGPPHSAVWGAAYRTCNMYILYTNNVIKTLGLWELYKNVYSNQIVIKLTVWLGCKVRNALASLKEREGTNREIMKGSIVEALEAAKIKLYIIKVAQDFLAFLSSRIQGSWLTG